MSDGGRRDGRETREAADVASDSEAASRDVPLPEEDVEDTTLLGLVEGDAGVMDIEDGPEGLAGGIQQY